MAARGKTLSSLWSKRIDFKISQPESSYVIGSSTIDSQGDLYVMDINQINKPAHIRNKRALDIALAIIVLMFSPFIIWVFKYKSRFLKNSLNVLIGKKSFVGYAHAHHSDNLRLPKIKLGVLTALELLDKPTSDTEIIARMNLIYAKNHSSIMDFKIIWNNFKNLDK